LMDGKAQRIWIMLISLWPA
jgi:hypothetical protein